ncbi:MAG: nucleotidyltransferase domain-containing protein [Proteobacteria bacterium]|nr:nucleotidyltransferase domain-containing protein [Pseudomonadota bacterium]
MSQGVAPSHLARMAAVHQLCERSPHCLGVALVGSVAKGCADRVSDLDLAAFVADDREAEFMAQAHEVLSRDPILNDYGQSRSGVVAFRKYVYLDFASCEFHAFNVRAPFKLRRPFIAVWDPMDFLETLVVDEPPPSHESFQPYSHGDEGLIWELVDCIKWLSRGHSHLAKNYLAGLGQAVVASDGHAAPPRHPPS